uniref:11-beta-hydroxysteroid dehydrogenase type 2 n=1 Tax=Salvator merianae TaxID=96440 RepID=A0A8D0BCH4_SALMN
MGRGGKRTPAGRPAPPLPSPPLPPQLPWGDCACISPSRRARALTRLVWAGAAPPLPLPPLLYPGPWPFLGRSGRAAEALRPPGPPAPVPDPPRARRLAIQRTPRPPPPAPAKAMLPGWACSAGGLWLLFFGCLAAQLLRSNLLLTPRLLLHVGLLLALQGVCRAFLPLPVGTALTGLACWLVLARAAPRRRLPADGKAVFITGCDSGFGKAAAHHLDSLGFTVYASVMDLKSAGAEELRRSSSPRLTLLKMDLTKAEDIQNALNFIRAQTGKTGLWGLVNNAGFNDIIADAELTPLHHFRNCMEVNFFGTLELTKGLLPLLRFSQGRIVTISSPAGVMPYPCLASYGSSKAALSLLMDTFQNELAPWGIKVSIIFPGYFKTASCNPDFWMERKDQLLATLPQDLLEAYGKEYIDEINQQFLSFMKLAVEDLSSVMESITDGLLAIQPLKKYYPGRGLNLMYFIHHYLPSAARNLFLKTLFISPKLPRGLQLKH